MTNPTTEQRPFTHRIYVDFSGDDGDLNHPGASRCLCIAWVMCEESNIWHNQGIVLQIKKAIGCSPKAELKYRSLRRHPKKEVALGLLSQIKAKVVLASVLKAHVAEEELKNPKTKKLVNLLHYFPLSRFINYFVSVSPNVYFQLIFDELGWKHCEDEIRESFNKMGRLDFERARPDWLLFTKSESSLMLQLADCLAGLGREYIEAVETALKPPCIVCWLKETRSCSFTREGKTTIKARLMRTLYPLLLKNDKGEIWESGYVIRPPEQGKYHLFVDCLFKGK